MSSGQSPVGDGEFVFQKKTYPSFWSRLTKQKQGLGVMALSASCCFLALSIIKQDKELNRVNEMASQLRAQNESLKERLENVKLAVQEDGVGVGEGLGLRLKDLLQIRDANIPLPGDPKEEFKDEIKKSIRGKFMVVSSVRHYMNTYLCQ
ncbi:hypothetical protein R1sor_026260 [Riccia sorocarpa]|uniref:Uncharacterized protein n=1 Tax=Riccia sorocarpa TaxID=122646 RepID=A0ABD3GDQ5_9MARC